MAPSARARLRRELRVAGRGEPSAQVLENVQGEAADQSDDGHLPQERQSGDEVHICNASKRAVSGRNVPEGPCSSGLASIATGWRNGGGGGRCLSSPTRGPPAPVPLLGSVSQGLVLATPSSLRAPSSLTVTETPGRRNPAAQAQTAAPDARNVFPSPPGSPPRPGLGGARGRCKVGTGWPAELPPTDGRPLPLRDREPAVRRGLREQSTARAFLSHAAGATCGARAAACVPAPATVPLSGRGAHPCLCAHPAPVAPSRGQSSRPPSHGAHSRCSQNAF